MISGSRYSQTTAVQPSAVLSPLQEGVIWQKLVEITEILATITNLDEALTEILRQLGRLIQYDSAAIYLVSRQNGKLDMVAASGMPDINVTMNSARKVDSFPLDQTVLQTGIPMIVPDVRQDDRWRTLNGSEHIRSYLGVPLLVGGKAIGLVTVDRWQAISFTQMEVRLATAFAQHAAMALQNARETKRFQVLSQAIQALGKVVSMAQIKQAYQIIIDIATANLPGQIAIFRQGDIGQTPDLVVANEDSVLIDKPALLRKLARNLDDERRSMALSISKEFHPLPDKPPMNAQKCSLIVTLLATEDRYFGVLGLVQDQVNHFEAGDLRLLEGLAQQLALTLSRLEALDAWQEAERRATMAEAISSVGRQAFEITHRLGNDLGLVKARVNMIKSALAQEKNLDTATMEATDDHLCKIAEEVQNVLEMSKRVKQSLLDSDRNKQPSHIPCTVLLQEAGQLAHSMSTNIQIEYDIPDDIELVYVNHGQAVDILHNLVSNAVEAMTDSQGHITFRARNTGQGQYVLLVVEDSGPGISQERQSKIFDLFYSTKGSSGFGLWSARRNAVANGGDLIIRSNIGQGSRFILRLPTGD
ncbi:MAG: GAF domain-containing protein [Chloroflexota bacterium]